MTRARIARAGSKTSGDAKIRDVKGHCLEYSAGITCPGRVEGEGQLS